MNKDELRNIEKLKAKAIALGEGSGLQGVHLSIFKEYINNGRFVDDILSEKQKAKDQPEMNERTVGLIIKKLTEIIDRMNHERELSDTLQSNGILKPKY